MTFSHLYSSDSCASYNLYNQMASPIIWTRKCHIRSMRTRRKSRWAKGKGREHGNSWKETVLFGLHFCRKYGWIIFYRSMIFEIKVICDRKSFVCYQLYPDISKTETIEKETMEKTIEALLQKDIKRATHQLIVNLLKVILSKSSECDEHI